MLLVVLACRQIPYGAGEATTNPVTDNYKIICMQGKPVPKGLLTMVYTLRHKDLYALLFFLHNAAALIIHVKVCTCSKSKQTAGISGTSWQGVSQVF